MKKEDLENKNPINDIRGVRVSKLTSDWCMERQLGKTSDSVEYTDYSVSPPLKERLDFDIEIIPGSEKSEMMGIASQGMEGDGIDGALIQDRYEELLISRTTGIDIPDVRAMKKNKSLGVYDAILTKIQIRLGGMASLSKSTREEAKNLDGQGQ